MIRRSILLAFLSSGIAGLPVLAVTGTVLDTDGRPIRDAKVCWVNDASNEELLCVNVDRHGAYELLESENSKLRVSAPGFFVEDVVAQGQQTVVLRRSPALAARVVDAATGKPLDKSEVWVVYPSAERKGPFPANRAGVKIVRVLDPGDVRVFARAEGYEDSEAVEVKLEPGKEEAIVLKIRRAE